MGIRFRCPNGHKLHVKAFLAGKRGICPKCGVKFYIPTVSGGQATIEKPALPRAAAIDPSSQDAATAIELKRPPEAMPTGMSATPQKTASRPQKIPIVPPQAASLIPAASPSVPQPGPVDPLIEFPDALWYVRPASGGQFGPASADILRLWIHEGRIGNDSYLWRDGWDQWRKADGVFPHLADMALLANQIDPSPSSVLISNTVGLHDFGRHQPKQSTRILAATLFFIVILLLIILLVVFWNQSG